MFTLYFGLKQMSTRHNGSLGFLHRKQETSDLWTHTHTMEKKTIWSRYVHFLFFLSHNVNREVNTEPSSKSLLFWSTPCVHTRSVTYEHGFLTIIEFSFHESVSHSGFTRRLSNHCTLLTFHSTAKADTETQINTQKNTINNDELNKLQQ